MNFGNIFEEISKNANIDKKSIFDLADSVKNADLTDEKVIRNLIKQVSKIANRPVSKELEDTLVEKIKKDGVPNNLSDLF